jgi:branched-chain amino acid transport system permease protein
MAIFGGLGQFYGPVVGAAIFAYLQEYLKTTFPYQYMLIFGAVLVLVIVFLPNGLAGIIQWLMRRWRKGGSEVQNADT